MHTIATTYKLLHPVGLGVPSQTVHFPEETYQWLLDSKREGQSMSNRVAQLVEKGKAWEEKHESD